MFFPILMFVTKDLQYYHLNPILMNFRGQVGENFAPISFHDNITVSTLEQVIRGADNDSIGGHH